MACPKCLRWQRQVRASQQKLTSSSKAFSTSAAVREDLTQGQNAPDQELSILKYKKRPIRSPNEHSRSAIHAIDVASRLGTRFSRPVVGTMEWQTSTYHYNKQTAKTLPVLASTTNKLLEAYAVLQKSRTSADGRVRRAPRIEIAKRRKDGDRVFMSNASVKDFGHKIVIDAFVHDAKQASRQQKDAKTARRNQPRDGANKAGTSTRTGPSRNRTPRVVRSNSASRPPPGTLKRKT